MQQTDSTNAVLHVLRLLNALICPKILRQALSLCGETESTYNTAVVNVGPAGSVGCVPRIPLISQPQPHSSTNQLALSPGSPARPSSSGDKVRFILGLILPGRLLSATVLCV